MLATTGISPLRGLSQNFLIDTNIAKKIVAASHITSNDQVLEIGPGLGAITQFIEPLTPSFFVIEKDKRLLPCLSQIGLPDHHIIIADALKIDWLSFFNPAKKIKILSNIPYHISTALVKKIISYHSYLDTVILLVQKEFAQKLLSDAKDSDYRLMSLLVDHYAIISPLFTIPGHLFYPKAGVDSMVISLEFGRKTVDPRFIQMIETAFAQKRKALTSSLKELCSANIIQDTLIKMGKSPLARPQELTKEEWETFFNCYVGSDS